MPTASTGFSWVRFLPRRPSSVPGRENRLRVRNAAVGRPWERHASEPLTSWAGGSSAGSKRGRRIPATLATPGLAGAAQERSSVGWPRRTLPCWGPHEARPPQLQRLALHVIGSGQQLQSGRRKVENRRWWRRGGLPDSGPFPSRRWAGQGRGSGSGGGDWGRARGPGEERGSAQAGGG